MSKQLTIRQYIKEYGYSITDKSHLSTGETITRQAIVYRIKNGLYLPHVAKAELIGNSYILTLS